MNNLYRKAQTGNMIMAIWFLFLLAIIGIGIAAGVYLFFGQNYEFRQIDAEILNHKVRECIIAEEFNFDSPREELEKELLNKCNLNQNLLDEDFSILIKINSEVKYNLRYDEVQCALADENDKFPKCTNSTLIKDSQRFSILTGSNQLSRKKIT